MTVHDLTITGGTGASVGGGIEVAGASNPVTVINVTLYNNAATGAAGRGGGHIDTGTSCIANSSHGSLVNVDTANCPSRDELGNARSSTCSAGAVQDNTPPANIPATPLPDSLWLILAGLAAWGIHSIWPSRIWTTRSP